MHPPPFTLSSMPDASATERVTAALRALDERKDLNAVITLCPDQALARARTNPTGRLAGVPLLVKDLIDTAGVRTTYGSRIHADHVPTASAPAVLALEAEGAIVVGKANCDEYAWGTTGQNVHWGDVGNPREPGRIAGGSSGGNAAALAAGLVPLALGTDTGGSVRMPAACCGVVALKPSTPTAPERGAFPLCASLDTIGPMASTVRDVALAHSILRAEPVPEPRIGGLTVGLLSCPPSLTNEPPPGPEDMRAEAAAQELEALGARVEHVELPRPPADVWPLFFAEAAASHRATFPARRDEYGPAIRAKLDAAHRVDPAAVRAAYAARAAWRAAAVEEPRVDLVLSPTLALDELPRAGVDELDVRVALSAYTRPWNFLGWPALARGRVQLAARDHATLLAAALAWEEAAGP